ncbi:MAG: transcription-repair coupling factor [Rhodospirillaceae bacterium]
MLLNELDLKRNSSYCIGGVPDGLQTLVVSELALRPNIGPFIYVTSNDSLMAEAKETLSFFSPKIKILTFPAWDCLPYDRVSPRNDILGQRVDTLFQLENINPDSPTIVLTTINSFVQRVPIVGKLEEKSFRLQKNSSLSIENLSRYLETNGFNRTGTVREPGEYAFRGGIIDIFAPQRENPVRIDLFGDEIDSLREFDPFTQQSTENLEFLTLTAVSELPLTAASIERFRVGYRGLFGSISEDPLYEAISSGQRRTGAEHWLPLFCDGMTPLSKVLPRPTLIFDHQFESAVTARLDDIDDFYDARMSALNGLKAKGAKFQTEPYRPLPPDQLYLTKPEISELLASQDKILISPFTSHTDKNSKFFDAKGRRILSFASANRANGHSEIPENSLGRVVERVKALMNEKKRVFISAFSQGSRLRLQALLAEHGLPRHRFAENWDEGLKAPEDEVIFYVTRLSEGFITEQIAVITEQDVLGDRLIRQSSRKRRGEAFLSDISELSPNDVVVHVEHGLGRYEGLETISAAGAPHDCLKVSYSGGDRLYVPVENIELLSRFGSEDSSAVLDKLGGAAWQARKSRLKERLREIAEELIKTAASRALKAGRKLSVAENVYAEFCSRFPFDETDDQLSAISDAISDLTSGRPMDRLICGDVGFGKTEVALRATFSAVMGGGQVAVIAPTTLLARQHYKSFTERFEGYPIEVRQLSRLISSKEANNTREGLADGTIDIVIGTHALLSKTVIFHDLALLVVDEEQHFGVNHKERLKQLRTDVHVLTLSATPIPRTLQMALSGVKDMSIIATPPVDRLAVRTFVMPHDTVVLKEAIMRERYRGGQIFYVCPRISDLRIISEELQALVPEVRVAVAHGQMGVSELEDVMNAFYEGKVDLLLSTQIVESGLDIPNANTLIIHRADMFGLAQLYQLRGRIGRSKVRAYCYLTLSPNQKLGETATKRLEVMQSLDALGAGFTLASHDLDIRGAGNLLGDEQSGHIREVGVELYQQMLEEAVAAARSGGTESILENESWSPTISLGTAVLIPESYVSDLNARLSLYRRASRLETTQEIEDFRAELVDRFGALPEEVNSFLEVISIKQLCKRAGIEKFEVGLKGVVIKFFQDCFEPLERLIGFIQKDPSNVTLRPDQQLVVRRDWIRSETRLKGAKRLASTLADMKA